MFPVPQARVGGICGADTDLRASHTLKASGHGGPPSGTDALPYDSAVPTPWFRELRQLHDENFREDWTSHVDALNRELGLTGHAAFGLPARGLPPSWCVGDVEAVPPRQWVLVISRRGDLPLPPSWGRRGRPTGLDRAALKRDESGLEALVSRRIGAMPFLWLGVDDAPGPGSRRALIERNAIALLSGYAESALDPPSPSWLGLHSDRKPVRRSGLWNNRHVDESYDPLFLDVLEELAGETQPP